MQHTEEWWHRMFEMHSKLTNAFDFEHDEFRDDFNFDILQEFKQQLDTIPYTYAKPREGLGAGALFVEEVATWFAHVSHWSAVRDDYDAAVLCLERALDYYCDPTLDYDDDTIDEAKKCMCDYVTKTIVGIYEGCHEIYDV